MSSGNLPSGKARGAAAAAAARAAIRDEATKSRAIERQNLEVIRNRLARELWLRQDRAVYEIDSQSKHDCREFRLDADDASNGRNSRLASRMFSSRGRARGG